MTSDHKANILLVGEFTESLSAIPRRLGDRGENVIVAGSTEEALQQVGQHDFAVILIAVVPPAMEGHQTAHRIQEVPRAVPTPILFLSSSADEEQVARGYALGAADYIRIPVNPDILRTKVRVFVDLFQRAAQAGRQAEERITLAQAQTARLVAEAEHRQAAFLAEATARIATAHEPATTVQGLARMAVPTLADLGIVTLFHDRQGVGPSELAWSSFTDGSITTASADPSALPAAYLAAVQNVLHSGQTERIADLAVPSARDQNRDGGWGNLAVAGPPFALRAALVLPLIAGNQRLGVLTLINGHSGRQFNPSASLLAEDLAGRAAIFLDNAHLHRETQEADKRKNEFLAMLAHELRNPLAAIRGAVHVLCMSDLGKDKIAWARAIIDRQVNQLVRLVDDLLDVARITQGKIRLQLEPVDISAIVDMAKELAVPLLVARHHNLSVSCPKGLLCVRGDAARLAQVLANLLNNAAKYTDVGGKIDLKVERDHDQVVVRVRDNGMGIPADLVDSIFDLFTQANRPLDRSQGGLGIGLTLVRHIVQMHGGSVSVTSAGQGQGSEFVVRLPLVVPPPQIKIPVMPPPIATAGQRVLVVDDNLDVADSLAILLRQRGHTVCLAHDGPAALSAAQTFVPQVVLLDIGLPGVDGFEVARRMRAMPALKGAFLVAITGYGQPEARLAATQAGFDVHLVKPVDPRALNQLMTDLPREGRG